MSQKSFEDERRVKLKEAIDLMPTECRCFDESVDGTNFSDLELRLAELEPKVEATLHTQFGSALPVGEEKATNIEIIEFIKLLEDKGQKYLKLATLLEEIESRENKV